MKSIIISVFVFVFVLVPRIGQTQHHLLRADSPMLSAIIPDFQVNENAEPNGVWQRFPSISTDGSGNFIITWEEENSPGGYDIYAQRYSNDGSPVGKNFLINDNLEGTGYSPSISTDNSGNFMIAWIDERNGDFDIYAQRFSSDGSVIGRNFKVNNDQESTCHNMRPSISTDGSGNFVIMWADKRNGDIDMYAQRYSSDGGAIGTDFKIELDFEHVANWMPDAYDVSSTADVGGSFMITWVDSRNNIPTGGNYDIYAQRYSNNGNAIGSNFKVNDDLKSAWQNSPSISTDDSGNFVIMWVDKRNGEYDNDSEIFVQRYSCDGTAFGSNFMIDFDFENLVDWMPGINYVSSAAHVNGGFVMTWTDERNRDLDIYAQRYSDDGTAIGINFKVNNDPSSAAQKDLSQTPTAFILNQNYPNPFNLTTVIQYQLPRNSMVTLEVYNYIGQRVKRLVQENQPAGIHTQIWDGTNDDGEIVPTGVYFYQLRSGTFSETKKMLLMQ